MSQPDMSARGAVSGRPPWRAAERAVIEGDTPALERLLLQFPELRQLEPSPYCPAGPSPDYSEGDARFILTREHQFRNSGELDEFFQALRSGANSPIARFEAAVDAIVAGDIETLDRLLRENPELTCARSPRLHHAALLHYVGANGVEGFRQKTPRNAVAIAEALLEAGAEVDAAADIYGRSTTLDLAATSIHPWLAGVQLDLMDALLRAGACVDAARLALSALHNGRSEAAMFLAERSERLDLETAAGVGRLDVVESRWSSATAEQLASAFRWACQYGRTSVVEFLLEKVDPAAAEGGLNWAATSGSLETVNLFLARRTPLETKNPWGSTPLGAALWCAERNHTGIHYAPVIEALIAAGARVDAQQGLKDRVEAVLRRRS